MKTVVNSAKWLAKQVVIAAILFISLVAFLLFMAWYERQNVFVCLSVVALMIAGIFLLAHSGRVNGQKETKKV